MYFMCPGGSWGVQFLTMLCGRVGPLLTHLRLEASEASRLAKARVLRVLEIVRVSSVRILHVPGRGK